MKPKIPSGWRRLRRGERYRKGDRYHFDDERWEGIAEDEAGDKYDPRKHWESIRRIRRRP